MRILPAMLLAAGLLAGLPGCESKDAGHSADPTQSLLEKGQAAFKRGDYDRALKAYQEALQREPRSAVILNLMGMA
jgi:outer membrane protein assembly factor BamD (BamD/ComL family)